MVKHKIDRNISILSAEIFSSSALWPTPLNFNNWSKLPLLPRYFVSLLNCPCMVGPTMSLQGKLYIQLRNALIFLNRNLVIPLWRSHILLGHMTTRKWGSRTSTKWSTMPAPPCRIFKLWMIRQRLSKVPGCTPLRIRSIHALHKHIECFALRCNSITSSALGSMAKVDG